MMYLLYGKNSGHIARKLWSDGLRVQLLSGQTGQEPAFVEGSRSKIADMVTCGIVPMSNYEIGEPWLPVGDEAWATNGYVKETGRITAVKCPGVMEMTSFEDNQWTAVDWRWNEHFCCWHSKTARRHD